MCSLWALISIGLRLLPGRSAPALCLGAGGKALADFGKELAAASGIAALLANLKAGLRLPFGDHMRHKVVEEPLHTGPGGSRRAQQRFMAGIARTMTFPFHAV